MSTLYRVQWNIELYADSPQDAVNQALRIHRDPESLATYFTVHADGQSPDNAILLEAV